MPLDYPSGTDFEEIQCFLNGVAELEEEWHFIERDDAPIDCAGFCGWINYPLRCTWAR